MCTHERTGQTQFFFKWRISFYEIQKIKQSQKRIQIGRSPKSKRAKKGGVGERIFTLLRLELEHFRFFLIKRNPKQKILNHKIEISKKLKDLEQNGNHFKVSSLCASRASRTTKSRGNKHRTYNLAPRVGFEWNIGDLEKCLMLMNIL